MISFKPAIIPYGHNIPRLTGLPKIYHVAITYCMLTIIQKYNWYVTKVSKKVGETIVRDKLNTRMTRFMSANGGCEDWWWRSGK